MKKLLHGIITLFVINCSSSYSLNGQDMKVDWSYIDTCSGLFQTLEMKVNNKKESFLTGYYFENFKSGSVSVNSKGGIDIFLAKYDSTGKCIWLKSYGGDSHGHDKGVSLACGKDGEVYLSGVASGNLDLGNNISVEGLNEFYFIAYINSNGITQWARKLSDLNNSFPIHSSVSSSADKNGDAYVAFSTYEDLPRLYEARFLKLDKFGESVWEIIGNGDFNDFVNAVTIDDNNVFLAGSFNSYRLEIGGKVLENTYLGSKYKGSNIFIAKIDLEGKVEWIEKQSQIYDVARTIKVEVDNNGNSYLFGEQGSLFLTKYSPSGQIIWNKDFQRSTHGKILGMDLSIIGNKITVLGKYNDKAIIEDTLHSPNMFSLFMTDLDENGTIINNRSFKEVSENSNFQLEYYSPDKMFISGFLGDTLSIFDKEFKSSNNLLRMMVSPTLVTSSTNVKNIEVRKFTVTPNPFNEKVYLEFNEEVNVASIELNNVFGHAIAVFDNIPKNNNKYEIDLGFLSKGLYFLSINKKNQIKIVKN